MSDSPPADPAGSTVLALWCQARGVRSRELARMVGCSERAARAWLHEGRRPIPAYLGALYRVTGLDEFRPTPSEELAAMSPRERETCAAAAAEVGACLDRLSQALRPFVTGSAGAREGLRRALAASAVARVTGLTELLFDEDRFSDWRLIEGALGERKPAPAVPAGRDAVIAASANEEVDADRE